MAVYRDVSFKPDEWRPMESAPQDFTWIQGAARNLAGWWMAPFSVKWSSEGYWAVDNDGKRRAHPQPEAWRTLPVLPETGDIL